MANCLPMQNQDIRLSITFFERGLKTCNFQHFLKKGKKNIEKYFGENMTN